MIKDDSPIPSQPTVLYQKKLDKYSITLSEAMEKYFPERSCSLIQRRRQEQPKKHYRKTVALVGHSKPQPVVQKNEKMSFKFSVTCPLSYSSRNVEISNRTYYFNCKSENERQMWVKAINEVIKSKEDDEFHVFENIKKYDPFLKVNF